MRNPLERKKSTVIIVGESSQNLNSNNRINKLDLLPIIETPDREKNKNELAIKT